MVAMTPSRFTFRTRSQASGLIVVMPPPGSRNPASSEIPAFGERDVEPTLVGDDPVDGGIDLRAIGDVQRHGADVAAVALAEPRRDLLQARLVDVREGHGRAAVDHHLRHRQSEAARGARDEHACAPHVEQALMDCHRSCIQR